MAYITLSVINDLVSDQRMHRIATALQTNGHQVLLIGRKLPASPAISDRPYQTHRMKLFFTQGKLFYLEYNWRLFWFLIRKKSDMLVANDLDTLLANYLASKVRKAELVYDTHEYFTEVPELIDRPLTRSIWLRLEKWLFPKLKKAYTVNKSIAEIYRQKYGVDVQVVRNLPFRQESSTNSLKKDVVIYQGAINLGRGIRLMMEAMEFLPSYEFWIFGGGDLDQTLRAYRESLAWKDRIIFHGRLPFDQLFEWTSQARLGFSLEEDLGANYHFASPNKVFDYIQASVPVLVSDLPEMRRTVEEFGVGEILEEAERNPKALAERIILILSNKESYSSYVQNCRLASKELNWEKEQEKLLFIYEKGPR